TELGLIVVEVLVAELLVVLQPGAGPTQRLLVLVKALIRVLERGEATAAPAANHVLLVIQLRVVVIRAAPIALWRGLLPSHGVASLAFSDDELRPGEPARAEVELTWWPHLEAPGRLQGPRLLVWVGPVPAQLRSDSLRLLAHRQPASSDVHTA